MKLGHLESAFTLLELLIALSIFSIMATLAYGGLKTVIDGQQQIEASAKELESLQRLFLFLQQDLQQLIPRAVEDEYGTKEKAFVRVEGESHLKFTRGGINGALRGSSDLVRIEYQLIEGKLTRKVWSVLDRTQGTESSRLRLLEGVQSLDFRFLSPSSTEWQDNWPIEGIGLAESNLLPRAVEVSVTTIKGSEIKRLFVVGS